MVANTISLDATKVINVAPRYARIRAAETREVIGRENIELTSDRSFKTLIDEFKSRKDTYPDRVLIASIMEAYRRDAWVEVIGRCAATGVHAFALNFSCPHGLPERGMGSAMGQDPGVLGEVCGWVNQTATIPGRPVRKRWRPTAGER